MIYIFDKTQAIIKVLTNDDFTAAHLNFKINTATTFELSLAASKALPSDSKYVATPHPLDDSKFIMLRLTERVDNTETIDYSAYELAYQELATDGYIEDKRPQNQSALNLMKIALDGTNWELNNVNVSGTATTNFYYVDHLSAISSVVDLLGGEIVFYIEIQGNAISGRYMDYLARQGADTSKVFASGSNLLTVERQSDTSNIYTAILPRGKGEEIDNGDTGTPDGYGRRINIADVEWKKSAGKPLDKPKGSIVLLDPDATAEWGQINGNARLLLQTYDDIDDVNVLINSAYKTLQSVNHPQIQYSATVADVGGLSLGDTVLIMHGDRDLSYKTRVFEVKYDLLAPDQTELSLGDDLSSNSITSQINNLNAVADTTSSQTQWTINQIGRPGTTYGETAPDSPKVGDIWFKYLPDGGTEIYRWNGDIWELLASPTTADDIANAVTDAVTQAKAHTDEVKQGLSTDIATAKSQATSQASTAEANAKSAATSQFTQAQNALSAAKTDLTNSIASEASARNAAVSAANSQAQTYANQAKADAMSAASSADGVIRTAISSSADSLSATITQNKSSADSGISTAQTTAQAAVDGLKFKVSQTDYNTKTGQLQTDLTTTTQTANQARTDIVSIKQKDSDQDAKMNSIVSDANGTKQTVSDLQTTQGKQSGDISTLQQRADGFDATVTKVNNLSVGGRNYLINSTSTLGWLSDNSVIRHNEAQGVVYDYIPTIAKEIWSYSSWSDKEYSVTSDGKYLKYALYDSNKNQIIRKAIDLGSNNNKATGQLVVDDNSNIAYIRLSIDWVANGYGHAKFEKGTLATDWSPAPEDLSGATAKAQLTADQATTAINTYKTSNDGRVASAESKITQNATDITQKVNQTDYNQKTGQLQTDLNTTTNTANAAKQDIATIKTDNTTRDSKINTLESDSTETKRTISQLSGDLNTVSGSVSQLTQRADGFDATVKKVNNLSVGGRNYILNSDVSTTSNITNFRTSIPVSSFSGKIITVSVQVDYDNITELPASSIFHRIMFEPVAKDGKTGNNIQFTTSITPKIGDSFHGRISATYDLTNVNIISYYTGDSSVNIWGQGIYVQGVVGTNVSVSRPKIEIGNKPTDWTPAPEDIKSALAQVKITADSISNFVRDSMGNISSDFQTALSKTSIITGSTLASSIQKQTSSQITQALTDNNKNIIAMINLDTSGVQIAGKNIVLNGDTTVTGAFKVSQANIANGAIGTAQIGDAAITNAKISDLDVSKITGNVSNFIQSNWNGVYESTTITNDGMQIFTSDIITTFGPYGINLTQGGESVGGIGVSSYVGMPTNFQGIAFNLDGTGDYMTWGARESGVTTGNYTTKLAWFRSSYKPIGQNAGFNFSSDSPVTFWGSIYGRDNTEPLKIDSFGMNGISAGGIGHNNGNSAITFGGDGETYVISGGKYYKLAKLVKALQPLIGLGTWSAPQNINSSGVVTKWTNVTT